MDVKVRDLNIKDVFAVARMLGKITKSARAEIVLAIGSKNAKRKVNATELGMIIVQNLCVEAEEDLKAWLADMVGQPVEEFEKLSPRVLIEIVKKLATQEDIKDFLSQVSQLVKSSEKTESIKPLT